MNQVDLMHAVRFDNPDNYYIARMIYEDNIFKTTELIKGECNLVKTTLNFLNGKYEKE